MNRWRKFWPFLAAGATYLVGQYFRGDWFVNSGLGFLCHSYIENGKTYCNSSFLDLGLILMLAGEMFAIVAAILLVANECGYKKWLKMSCWYVPIAALIIWTLFPAPFVIVQISRETATRDLGVLYLLITLGIVLWSRWKN